MNKFVILLYLLTMALYTTAQINKKVETNIYKINNGDSKGEKSCSEKYSFNYATLSNSIKDTDTAHRLDMISNLYIILNRQYTNYRFTLNKNNYQAWMKKIEAYLGGVASIEFLTDLRNGCNA